MERIEGNKSIWDTISKEKIETFSSNNKSVNVKVNNSFVQIKEERKLMTKLLVVSRSRPDIDLSTYLGEYEFTVVPGSLFASDGTLHQTTDKSAISTELRKMLPQKYEEDHHVSSKRVIVFDGMALVNKIDIKKSKIKTCLEFSDHFIKIVKRESTGFNEVRVVFDRYDETSLKNYTRSKRHKGEAVHYKVYDSTQIGHLTSKQFLSSVKTKNELTIYLSKKLKDQLNVDFVIVFGNTCITNLDV